MEKAEFERALKKRENVEKVLMFLYNRQTEQERRAHGTVENNFVGFNRYDAGFLSSVAEWVQATGFLTDKQTELVRKKLIKYYRQIPSDLLNNGSSRTIVRKPAGHQSQISAKINGRLIEVRFPYNPELVTKIKAIPGRRWNPNGKFWTVPIECAKRVQEDLRVRVDGTPDAGQEDPRRKEHRREVPKLKHPLYPFQEEGVRFLLERDGRALIADEMGLGKTVQSIGWLAANPEERPALIVVPASLKINWAREIRRFMSEEETVILLSGRKPDPDLIQGARILVINYDVLSAWIPVLSKIGIKAMVMDEVHYIKNRAAQRTKAVQALAKRIPHVIGLSGTPITNRPAEFFTALSLIAPELFSSWWKYTERYCGRFHDGFGWNVNGATNTEELHRLLTSTIMIRRTKEDVLKDLPSKTRSVIPLEIENATEYRRAESDFERWVAMNFGSEKASSAMRAEALARITYLKRLSAEGKIAQALAWIRDFLESGQKLVIFAVHRDVIDRLMTELRDYEPVKVDGSVSLAKRQEAVDRFQKDERCRVFIGNIKAAGVGLTLTAASATCFVELAWTPGDHDQAEDRVHRIGQKESVFAYYLVAENTIEEEIAALIDQKRGVLASVLDGKDVSEESMLTELLKRRTANR